MKFRETEKDSAKLSTTFFDSLVVAFAFRSGLYFGLKYFDSLPYVIGVKPAFKREKHNFNRGWQ